MPRTARSLVGGYVYHVLNRANGRLRLFKKEADFAAFDEIVTEAHQRLPLRILGYVVMGNHWHFLVWPRRNQAEQVSNFFRWLSITHAQRWHASHPAAGTGHLYQGRFKSFPVAADEHLLSVLRFVERNPVRAGLVTRAERWRFGSFHRRMRGNAEERSLLTDPPVPLGKDWGARVNRPQSKAEEAAICQSIARGRPFGSEAWQHKVAELMNLTHTFNPRGRPRKVSDDESQ